MSPSHWRTLANLVRGVLDEPNKRTRTFFLRRFAWFATVPLGKCPVGLLRDPRQPPRSAAVAIFALMAPDRRGGTEDTIRRAQRKGIPITIL
jgi:hypothetical protein